VKVDKVDKVGGTCSTHTGDEKFTQYFNWKSLKRRGRLDYDLRRDNNIKVGLKAMAYWNVNCFLQVLDSAQFLAPFEERSEIGTF
jgi:hypothetical protein